MPLDLINFGLALARSMESPLPEPPQHGPTPTESKLNVAWRVVVTSPPGVCALRMTAAAWAMEARFAQTAPARDAALAAAKSANDKLATLRAKVQP